MVKNDFYPSVADLCRALHRPELTLPPDLAIGRFRGRRFVLYSFVKQARRQDKANTPNTYSIQNPLGRVQWFQMIEARPSQKFKLAALL